MTTRLLIDAHLDISWNALSFDRDQTQTIAEIRESEKNMSGKPRGKNTVSLPEMRKAGVGVCLATLLARALPTGYESHDPDNPHPGISNRGKRDLITRENLDYVNQTAACCMAIAQNAYYQFMVDKGEMVPIRTKGDLQKSVDQWQAALSSGDDTSKLPIGYILSMEGADPIITPDQAKWWFDQGLRTVCLAHYGPSAYAMGTGGDGPLTKVGFELVKAFDEVGMILDLVHTADEAIDQALDLFTGGVFVSHGNCRALVPGDRQISDEQIKAIADRGGVIGHVTDNWMLLDGYIYGETPNDQVTIGTIADHVDHVCQLTGSSKHTAIGSDLDGGYGTEQCPGDLNTIADLQKLGSILADRGYSDEAINDVFYDNWLRFFEEHLPSA